MNWFTQGAELVSATFFRAIVVRDAAGEECDDEEAVTASALVTPVRKANRRGHPDTWRIRIQEVTRWGQALSVSVARWFLRSPSVTKTINEPYRR